jgi:hypothetical protein
LNYKEGKVMNTVSQTMIKSFLVPMLLMILSVAGMRGQAKPMTADDLAKRADAIVVGKVTGLKSEWSSDRSRIYTRVTLGVDQYLKGKSEGGSMTILTPGGEIGDVGELYTHMPTFRSEENVIVFVEKDKQGNFRVAGGNQGKYTIEKDENTGRSFVAGRQPVEEFARAVQKAVIAQPEK